MSKKDKIPSNFKGCIIVLSSQNRINYEIGDVIEIEEVDWSLLNKKEIEQAIQDKDPIGRLAWDNPLFDVRFIENMTEDQLLIMKEPFTKGIEDGQLKRVSGYKRKYQFDVDAANMKDIEGKIKDVLSEGDISTLGVIKEKELDDNLIVTKKNKGV